MHIYIHVPFCARRCSYCDFAIAVRRETPDRDFIDAIRREWDRRAPDTSATDAIQTVYFGGGTPSRLQASSIGELIELIGSRAAIAPGAEITLEANLDDVTDASAEMWARAGVNRVSLGVQTHNAAVLEWMHRTHGATQPLLAAGALRRAGIVNISMDLIFALPVALGRDWRDDVERTLALEPTHLSLYGLTVEPHTPLSRWVERGASITSPDERYAEEYLAAHDLIESRGYEHYEVSNAARPGCRSRHNSVYWSGAPYIGLGPSAHSFTGGVRRWNVRDWAEYQRLSAAGEAVEGGFERLDAGAILLERRYLGLRTRNGLPVSDVGQFEALAWSREGWATVESGIVRLTAEGWLRLDALVGAAAHS